MKIKKYIKDKIIDNKNAKLLSYGALATAFLANTPDASAQCAGETAVPGAPIGLDIDGDGTDDVQILAGSYTSILSSGTYTVPQGTIPAGTLPAATATAMGSLAPITTTIADYYGCYVAFGVAFGSTMLTLAPPPVTAIATASAMVSYTNAFVNVAYATYVAVNYCFVTGLGSNQIVGLSATGTGVCGVIDSAPGVAGTGTYSLVGYNYSVISAYAAQLAGGIRYDFPSISATAMATVTTVVSGISCATNTASVYGGYFYAGPVTLATSGVTAVVPPLPDATYPGPYALGTPVYGSAVLATGGANAITAVAVQFIGGDGNTYNGWVTLSCNGDGTITCTGSGYQQCSIETAIAEATAADSCISVGEATNSNAACGDVPPPPPPSDVPTLSQWGLITLMLALMSYGAIAMSNFGELATILKRREEEELV